MPVQPGQSVSVLKLNLSNGTVTDHVVLPSASVSGISSSPSAKTWS